MNRLLADLSLGELHAELAAAKAARSLAEYQDGLSAWGNAVRDAELRQWNAQREIDRRLALVGAET